MFYWSMYSDKDKKFYYYHRFSRINLDMRTFFMDGQNFMEQIFSLLLCLYPLYPLLYLLNSFFCLFYSCYIYHSLLQSMCLLWMKIWICIFFCRLFECMWWQICQTANLYWPSPCLYQAKNMAWSDAKTFTYSLLTKINDLYNK